MEFKEVIGRRRSIRYFVPYRPVEREKIQTILEATRLASCAVNATFLRAIVVQRDELEPAVLEGLKTPVSALNLELAPVHIYFYGDLRTLRESRGQTLKALIDVGALTPSHGWSHAYVEQAPDAIITTCLRDTSDGKTIHSRSRQHYAAQIDAFQRQVPGSLRQQVQYGRIVRSFLIHNGVMLQAGWQYRPHSTSE